MFLFSLETEIGWRARLTVLTLLAVTKRRWRREEAERRDDAVRGRSKGRTCFYSGKISSDSRDIGLEGGGGGEEKISYKIYRENTVF